MVPLLALLGFSSPITLEVSIPKEVVSGQPVPVVVRAKNVSNLPLTLVKAIPPNQRIGIEWKTSLVHDGRPVMRDESSPWMAQWILSWRIRADEFFVLQPGECAVIYQDKFSGRYDAEKMPSLKSEASRLVKRPLPGGAYTFKAHFAFHRGAAKSWSGEPNPKFEPEAKRRYSRTWIGSADGEARFAVVPAKASQ
ncbi:hypothetical protein [Fimbriimonas ginsengisoli]|uniref:Uncharacterized protein n=1 Tax=Fimbriimonas ginsengisoli Gsoil 348 TaxID=661478 RepID=A0A068NMD5_FIMGI|nr:hypothetical protein [Fimbriimonas ginsengisoli]AIE84733.1 hypothetical protein OP10G_1365 [Fimbriimonas ginsengisoli Gsoil 348]